MGFWDILDTATMGMVTDWRNGNRLTAIAKGVSTGLLVGAAALAVAGVAPAIAGGMAVASTVIGLGAVVAPEAGAAFMDSYNSTLQEMERNRTRSAPPATDDRSSAAPNPTPQTYAAVDTTRLTTPDSPPIEQTAAPVVAEQTPAAVQPAAARPAATIRPA